MATNLLTLAAKLANCKVEEIMSASRLPDGSMTVVIFPGPKHHYSLEETDHAASSLLTTGPGPMVTKERQALAPADTKMVSTEIQDHRDPDAKMVTAPAPAQSKPAPKTGKKKG
jgi:hypothetical protein